MVNGAAVVFSVRGEAAPLFGNLESALGASFDNTESNPNRLCCFYRYWSAHEHVVDNFIQFLVHFRTSVF